MPTTSSHSPVLTGRMLIFIGNSPGHIEAEAEVKYCVADPWKARVTWECLDRHQLLAQCCRFLPHLQSPGTEAQEHTTARRRVTGKTGSELQGRVPHQSPAPVTPALSHQCRTETAWTHDTPRPHPSLHQEEDYCGHCTHFLFPDPPEHPQATLG